MGSASDFDGAIVFVLWNKSRKCRLARRERLRRLVRNIYWIITALVAIFIAATVTVSTVESATAFGSHSMSAPAISAGHWETERHFAVDCDKSQVPAHCCTLIHCSVVVPSSVTMLKIRPLASCAGIDKAELPPSEFADRLDRPPKTTSLPA